MQAYREEKRKVKRRMYRIKKKVNEEIGRKMNEDVNGNGKSFWKGVKNGKVEKCSRIKDGNRRLAQG